MTKELQKRILTSFIILPLSIFFILNYIIFYCVIFFIYCFFAFMNELFSVFNKKNYINF